MTTTAVPVTPMEKFLARVSSAEARVRTYFKQLHELEKAGCEDRKKLSGVKTRLAFASSDMAELKADERYSEYEQTVRLPKLDPTNHP